jgi:hypothetical protein
MMRAILCTRPAWERATEIGSYWYEQLLYPIAKEEGIKVIDLYKSDAQRQFFRERIRDEDPIFVCGIGHGSDTKYTGWYNDILLDADNQMDWIIMSGRSGSFLSCRFGNSGERFVENGMKGFRGYVEDFVFLACETNDGCAEPFMRSHIIYDFTLARGKTHGEAFEEAKKSWNDAIANSNITSARFLIHDRDADRFYGDPNYAPFYKPPAPPTFKCYWCGKEYNDLDELLKHVCADHCRKPMPCILPRWLRHWLKCPLQ